MFLDKKLSGLVPYVPGEQPPDMDKLIKLNTNESPFEPSPQVVAAVNEACVKSLRFYSDPECRALKKTLGEDAGLPPEQVFTGNGSDEILALLFHGFCENGAVFADITYGFYGVYCEMFSVKKNIVPLREDFTVCVSDYKNQKGTVFIANPNAPTGICLPAEEIGRLCGQDSKRLVVVDEAYIDFGGESAVGLLDRYANLLVVRTMSKSRSLAGGRVGYAFGSEELIGGLEKLRYSFNPYNINSMSMAAGIASVKDRDYFQLCRSEIIKTREMTANGLRGLGFTVLPSSANFVFARPPHGIFGEYFFSQLRRGGILVRRFDKPKINDFLRITIGTGEQMKRFLELSEQILTEYGKEMKKEL